VTKRSAPAAPPAILESIMDATLTALLQHSTDFIALAALDGQLLFVNPAGQHLVGLTEPVQAGATVVFDYVAAEERERFQTAIWPAVMRHGHWEGETPLRHFKTGRALPMLHRLFVIKDTPHQQPRALAMISRTITEQTRVEMAVRDIAEGVSAAVGATFFRSLMQYLARTLAADYAFVGAGGPEHGTLIRTVAAYGDGQIVPNFVYDLQDTPCQQVTRGTLCVYPDHIQSLFPQDRMLAQMGIEGYVGMPLFDARQRVIGLLVVLSRRPLEHPALWASTLRIFATRAAAELERQQVEEAMCASEQRWRTMFQSAAIGIALVDASGHCVQSNQALQHMLGYTADELGRMSFVEFTHPDDTTQDWALVSEMFAGQRDHYQLEKRYIRKDGQVRWGHLTASAIRDGHGGCPFVLGMVEDITERKRAEAALRASEEMSRQIAEHLQDALWLQDSASHRMLYVNQAYEAIWGQTHESLYHQSETFVAVVHPEDRARVARMLQERRAGLHQLEEYRITRPDGTVRWIQDRSFPIRERAGNVYRVAGIAQDITQRKQAEEQLRATSAQLRALTARLRSAREQEGLRIAREIHDELGAALTSLKWDLEELATRISRADDLSLVPAWQDKIRAMGGLIDTTIHVVRRIAAELRPSVLDDLGLAAAVEWQAQQFQARTGILCHYEGVAECLAMDREQSTAIFRILQEALTNVLRHAQATRVDVSLEEAGAAWVLTIRDNGRGMTTAEQSAPHALGLLGMRERAHLIGGSIDITGMKGQGTTVTLRVPYSSDQSVERSGPA
jgi:PAS domain S-box-containing protein